MMPCCKACVCIESSAMRSSNEFALFNSVAISERNLPSLQIITTPHQQDPLQRYVYPAQRGPSLVQCRYLYKVRPYITRLQFGTKVRTRTVDLYGRTLNFL